jgi:hypothetical protein
MGQRIFECRLAQGELLQAAKKVQRFGLGSGEYYRKWATHLGTGG